MDYEKKYKEALERAKKWRNAPNSDKIPTYANRVIEEIFPELKESEDERMRKEITDFIRRKFESSCSPTPSKTTLANWITWLEQQGEKKPGEDSLTLEEFKNAFITKAKQYDIELPNRSWDIYALCKELYSLKHKPKQSEQNPDKIVEKAKTEKQRVLLTETDGTANIDWDCRSLDDVKVLLSCGLEFIRTIEANKQIPADSRFGGSPICVPTRYDKPTDKVEPKFKEGDWVIDKQGIVHQIADVVEIAKYHYYGYDIVGGGYFNDNTEGVRRWTIQDAKDGDVLVCESEWACIFKTLVNDKTVGSYCFVDCTGWFCQTGSATFKDVFITTHNEDVHPATQEQRDTLFQKMEEAGYEWDAENKVLKKL